MERRRQRWWVKRKRHLCCPGVNQGPMAKGASLSQDSVITVTTGPRTFPSYLVCNLCCNFQGTARMMLRVSLSRALVASRQVNAQRLTRLSTPAPHLRVNSLRYNSSSIDAARAEAKKIKEQMQADWTAPKLTYEQVKPRTEQPSPVRSECIQWTARLTFFRTHTSSTFANLTRLSKDLYHPPSTCH